MSTIGVLSLPLNNQPIKESRMMKRKEKTIQVQDDAGNPDRVIIYVRVLDASDQDDPTATLEGMREARLESTGEHLNVKEPGQLFQSVDGRRSFRALK